MKLYVVRNHEGKFFRPVGMGGRGGIANWKTELEKAKFYPKIGTARAVVSKWYSLDATKKYPVCDILEFNLDSSNAAVIKNDDYVKVARIKMIKREITINERQLISYRHTMYARHHCENILRLKKELDGLLQP